MQNIIHITLLLLLLHLSASIVINIPAGSIHRVRDAALSANSGDELILGSGMFDNCTTINAISISVNITLRGSETDATILSCPGATAITLLTGCNGTVIESLYIENAVKAVSLGVPGRISLRSVTIIGKTTGVHAYGSGVVLDIYNSTISRCVTAIFAQSNAVVSVMDTEVSHNIGTGDEGAGVYAYIATINLIRCTIFNNTATYGAGFNGGADGSIIDCLLYVSSCCTLSSSSAMITRRRGLVVVCIFTKVHQYSYTTQISRIGAIFVLSSTANISGVVIERCNALSAGGGYHGGGDSVVVISNSTFFLCSAVIYGGAVSVQSGGILSMNYVNMTDCRTTTSGGSGGAVYVSHSTTNMNNVLIERAYSKNGGGLNAYSSTIDVRSTVIRQSNDSGLYVLQTTMTVYDTYITGCQDGIIATAQSHVVIGNTTVTRSSRYGVYDMETLSSIEIDARCFICGNLQNQVKAIAYTSYGNSVCGTIGAVNYLNAYNSTIYPGMNVSISAKLMTSSLTIPNSNDYIRLVMFGDSGAHLTRSSSSSGDPVYAPLPWLPSPHRGPIETVSALGRRSMSYYDYDYGVSVMSTCNVAVYSGPSPSQNMIFSTTPVIFELVTDCPIPPYIIAYFDNESVECWSGVSSVMCVPPVRNTTGTVPLVLEIRTGYELNERYNVTGMIFDYVPNFELTSVSPSTVNNGSYIILCGVIRYNWAVPRCLFDGETYRNASWHNDTCVVCEMTTRIPCTTVVNGNTNTTVTVSFIEGHYSNMMTVIHACKPFITVGMTRTPEYMSVPSSGEHDCITIQSITVMDSEYLRCRFNETVTDAVYINATSIQCHLPVLGSNSLGILSLYVSTDSVQYEYVTYIQVKLHCPVAMTTEPSPRRFVVGQSLSILFYIDMNCEYPPNSMRCHFGDNSTLTTSITNDTVKCVTPLFDHPGAVNVSLEVMVPGSSYFVTVVNNINTTIEIYDIQNTDITWRPNVANNASTVITLCGFNHYEWANITCRFGQSVYSIGYYEQSCIRCLYVTDYDCVHNNVSTVSIAFVENQYSLLSDVMVAHVCKPQQMSTTVTVSPRSVIVPLVSVTWVFVDGVMVTDTGQYFVCDFSGHVTPAYYITDTLFRCLVPDDVINATVVILSVSHDGGQTLLELSEFEFSDGSALRCDAGYEVLDDKCAPCKNGYFKNSRSSDYCDRCPKYMTTSSRGATSRDECECEAGYAAVMNGSVVSYCLPCNNHATCPGGTSGEAADRGYALYHDVIVTCIPDSACVGDSKCAPEYQGDRCSECKPDHYRLQWECVECSRTSIGYRVPLMMAFVLFCVVYLFRTTLRGSNASFKIAAIIIGYNFLQVFALIGSVPGQISEPYRSTFQSLSTVNFNIQVMALECETDGLDYFNFLLIKMMAIPALLLCLWVVVMVTVVMRKCFRLDQSRDQVLTAGISTATLMMVMLYLAVTSYVLSYVGCTILEDGTWVLDASPDIECFGTEHLNNLWIFVLGMIVYVIGIPVVLYYIVVIKRNRLLTTSEKHDATGARGLPSDYRAKFGFLSMKYHDYVYWWELIVMARKAGLVIAFTIWSRSIALKIEIAALILVASAFYHSRYKPFVNKQLDDMEGITLLANSLVLIAGLGVFVTDELHASTFIVYTIFAVFVCICICILLYIIVRVLRYVDDGDDDDDTEVPMEQLSGTVDDGGDRI